MACLEGIDFFGQDPIQTVVEKTDDTVYYPLNKVFGEGPVEFIIPPEDSRYIDLRRTKMFLVVRILNEDGSDIAEDENVAFANLPFQLMWKQAEISANDVIISTCSPTYHLRAYLTTLLSYGFEAKNTQMKRELWQEDTPGQFDNLTGGNFGLKFRQEYTKGSRKCDLYGYLHLDLMQQEHYLLNGTALKLRFIRNPHELLLMAPEGTKYKVVIDQCELHFKKHMAYPGIVGRVEQELRSKTAKYNFSRVVFKQMAIPANQLSFHYDNLFLGQQPHRAVVFMIDQEAYNGAYHKNPYNFKHNHLTDLRFNIEGELFPQIPFKPNFEEGLYIRCYESLFEALGKSGLDEGNNIHRNWYDKGYTIFAADFTPDSSDGCTRNAYKTGKTGLSGTFAYPLPNDIYLFVMAEFNNKMELNANRHVILDYTL